MRLTDKGFTLAEVLLTLVIVGIVAALTIPALVNQVGDDNLKKAWKKTYTDLNQAAIHVLMDNSGTFRGVFTNNTELLNKFSEKMSYVKKCTSSVDEGCFYSSSELYFKSGESANTWDLNKPGLVLGNGAALFFNWADPNCTDITRCGEIAVDVNGSKKPNIIGKDFFLINIVGNRIAARGAQGLPGETGNLCNDSSWGGMTCGYELLKE